MTINKPMGIAGKTVLGLLPMALLILLAVGLANERYTTWLFVHTTYYFLMAMVLCWAGTHLHAARGLRRVAIVAWARENWPGVVVALVLTVVAWHAVEPALRILSDEANLVGTSKNLFASQTATFTISGKSYYDSYWDVDVAIDQRPALFPFLVSLVHSAWGYSYRNAFLLNLMVLPAFLLVTYRLAKRVGGETVGLVASLLVLTHPILLMSARSGGFDFLAAFFALLVVKSFFDHSQEPSPARLAMLWMNLCMFAEIRYEGVLFMVPVVAVLLLFRLVSRSLLAPYAFIYAVTPAFLLPRLWQAVLRGSVPRQDPGTIAFSVGNFANNAYEYLKPILSPLHGYPAHSAIVIALGIAGCALWLHSRRREIFAREWKALGFPIFVSAWMLLVVTIVFAYAWGRTQAGPAARLAIPIDTFLAIIAAWALCRMLKPWPSFVAVLLAVSLLFVQVTVASQHRMLNRLTQTRESATTWRFFESLHEKRILIVTDRPNHFTIMEYGAMSFEAAQNDPMLFEALARRLFYDVYVIQQISLSSKQPLPGYDIWPTRRLLPMLEFQNDANVLVRISRLAR